MKRKDDLLRLAFGELSDDAARAVQARADDSERVEVESFRQLHAALRHLPPPPPDNLSAERLRAAILDRELKTRRPVAWGSFLFAPVALAAVAAFVLLPRLRPRPEPQIVADLSRVEAKAALGPRLADEFAFHRLPVVVRAQPQAVASATASKIAPPQEDDAPIIRRHHVRHHHASEPVEEPQMDTQGMQVFNFPHESVEGPGASTLAAPIHDPKPQTIAAPASKVVEAEPGATGKTQTVVIVSSKRDLETGAIAATEKEASSVLVGG